MGDYDNDGFDDIFITCWGQNILFHNDGNGTFTDVTEKAGLLHPGTRYGAGCTWIDYDRDGKLDLFVSHYMDFEPDETMPARGKDPAATTRAFRSTASRVPAPRSLAACITTTATGRSPT